MADHLSVVFSKSTDVNNHLFGKAIRWAEQNPHDLVYWFRRRAFTKVPKVDVEWSSTQISALRRVVFNYNEKNLTGACMYSAMADETFDDVAAMLVSIPADVKATNFGGLLASLAHFCTQNLARAVVCVENWEEEKPNDTGDESSEPVAPADSCDVWEKGPTKYDSENLEELQKKMKSYGDEYDEKPTAEIERGPEAHLKRLKLISTMYSNNIFEFNDAETGLLKLRSGKLLL